MEPLTSQVLPIKSALFVDFDNIYIGLTKTDPQAAERFASDPARWLAWLERGLPNHVGPDGIVRPRSILVRRCYPNPDAGFRRFRSFFTSAAFSVIDCPSQTRAGKNSADIYMVMDILDTLNHRTNFDEFIVFSGDSDFLPVLLRLRAYDRRTTTLAIDFMPPAYRAACDLVINEEEFIEDALGISNEGGCGGNGNGRGRVSVGILKDMANRVYDAACESGEVAGADLPDILKDFREFRESNNWLGFGTSQRLAEALLCGEPRLQLVRLNPMMYKIILVAQGIAHPDFSPAASPEKEPEKAHAAEREITQPAPRAGKGGEKVTKTEIARLRAQIISTVKDLAGNSQTAILLARASQFVVSKIGPQVLETQWAGMGSFKRLLQSADNLGLEITTQPEPGYIFDPVRHPHPSVSRGRPAPVEVEPPAVDASAAAPMEPGHVIEPEVIFVDDEVETEESYHESLPSLEEFSRRVCQVTGAPDLTSKQYSLVFRGIYNELQEIAEGHKVYNTYQSSKSVSDWCAEQGETVARSDVVLIFKGIIFQDGVRFGKRPGSYTVMELASVVRDNIWALCRRARMELSQYEDHLLDEWILGDLEQEALSEQAGEPGEPKPVSEPEPQDASPAEV